MSSGNIEINKMVLFSEIALYEKDTNLNHDIELVQEKHLTMAKKIHNLLQKSLHCESQRALMKLYLKKIYNKILFNKELTEERKSSY